MSLVQSFDHFVGVVMFRSIKSASYWNISARCQP